MNGQIYYGRIIAAIKEFADDNGYYYTSQLTNEANWQAHIKSTGPEIVEDTDGEVDYAVMLAAAVLAAKQLAQREENAGKKIVVILPDDGMKYLSMKMYK